MPRASSRSMPNGCSRSNACRCCACSTRASAACGLFKGDRVIGVLRELIGDCADRGAAAVVHRGGDRPRQRQGSLAAQGKLFDAIRASIATPAIFTPSRLGGKKLARRCAGQPVADRTDAQRHDRSDDRGQPGRRTCRPCFSTRRTRSAATIANGGNDYRQRIRAFIEGLGRQRADVVPTPGLFDIAFDSMQVMQDTIARLKLAAYAPDVTIEIPRNACGYSSSGAPRK